MAIITLPSKFVFQSVESFRLQRSSNTLRSRYTGQRQSIVFPFAVWFFEGTLLEYDGIEASRIRSFLVQLEGQKNSFRLPVPGYAGPITGYTGIEGSIGSLAVARASSIFVSGFTATAQPYLAEGDYFTIQDELKMVTQDVSIGAGLGSATINFKPALRKPAAGGTPIKLYNPTILLNAAEDNVAEWSLKAPIRHGINIKAIEDISI